MGLLSNISRPANRSPSSSFFIPRFFVVVAALSFTILLFFEVDSFVQSFVSSTKTIAGHNLEPTPWHPFPPKPSSLDQESKYSVASKILQCSYLSCGRSTTDNTSQHNPPKHDLSKSESCPDFFKYIHRDLEPWTKSKISARHIMGAQNFAAFRILIIGGKLYVDLYYACVQSRAMFTIWSFLQLLRRYPGKIPDVDLMFDCMDKPTINRTEHASMPLPLFRYCTTPAHFDIPFPDWSFWGWSEINIQPWEEEFRSIKEGSQAHSWRKKSPIAYWKGNPDVASPLRMALLQCNDTEMWRAQIMRQDWGEAARGGFKQSKLSDQCNHQYKIYTEGYAWSVSLKYILACGSVPLIVSPEYLDFFSRGLTPQKNYLPVRPSDLCLSIKLAVEWGYGHPDMAEAVGRAAQDFIGNLTMDRVYDYMYHLLVEYSKLLDFRPRQPPAAMEVCVDSVLCFADENQRRFLRKSLAFPSSSLPCSI
ncbi:protein O-glucosyltransferase 1 [Coffea eugenioides]|uniref:Glycosyl transferase CAP10 domain-containing protein n=1 Tax=Coffea arabica TaxID=13443 RepID=A0A6P6UIQ9_COFAR|nr:protein O-glucosyltransferase 1-like [Coffea arabica]XP_027180936.1 protein O-glucosyltransferase 1 [Coffea eugenioides]